MNTLAEYAEVVPLWITIAAIAVVGLEWLALTLTGRVERHREGWVNILCGAASFLPVFALSMVVTLTLMFALYSVRIFDLGLDLYVWVLAYIAYDLMSFLVHLASHKVRLLWCMHSVHHAPEEMKASVSFRGSLADWLVTPHTTLWLPLFGFHPLLVVLVEGVGLIYGVFLHLSDAYMPAREPSWLQRVLITPAFHRLHHAKNPIYLDTNYGLTFSLWDVIFRTRQVPVSSEQPAYGLTVQHDASKFGETQLAEFKSLWRDVRSTPRLGDKLGFLLRPPGWHPLGLGQTARHIREEALRAADAGAGAP
ncbi:MAG: sterol desaturase family protein [Bradymonadia bacterium]